MKKYSLSILLAVVLAITSCTKELEEVNVNPNASENAQPDYLLTAAIKTTADAYWGTASTMNSSLLFVQHWAKIQYTEEDRYVFSNTSFQSLWTAGYSQSLTNLNKIIELGEAQNHPNYKGVALVLRSWVFQLLTDVYGDIPYRQAGNIDQYITPAYDTQKDVYVGLLEDLKNARGLLDPAAKAIAGDVIYSGNIAKWQKLANSLRLRIALRIADKEPAAAKAVLDELARDSAVYISDNADNAQMVYLASPNQNPVNALFETRDDYRVSKSMVDKLIQLSDPRLPIYVNKTQAGTTSYVGVPNGLTTSDASNLGFARTSKPGTYFVAAQAPAVIITWAEVVFARAEAAARGFTTEDAAALYQQAIKASLKQYGISEADVNTYLAKAEIQYD